MLEDDTAPALPRTYFHDVPDRHSDAEMAELHLQCFTTPAGRAVLDRWYASIMLRHPPEGELGQRHIGKQDFFREVIDLMQKAMALRRERARGGIHGRSE